MFLTAKWYLKNLQLLGSLLPAAALAFDPVKCEWICIDRFPLPSNFQQKTSPLLLILPGITAPITVAPQCCYLEGGLRGNNGAPMGFSGSIRSGELVASPHFKVDLRIEHWAPAQNVLGGDNFGTILKILYDQLKSMKEIL